MLSKYNNYVTGSDIGTSFYVSYQAEIDENFTIEIKPGIFFGGDFFSGFEVGSFLRYSFTYSKIYFLSGVNLHLNNGTAHGLSRMEFAKDDLYINIGLGIGTKLNNSINIAFNYYQPLKINYGYIAISENEISEIYQTKLFRIYKLGIEFYIF
jgi:hypothetical protein